MTQTYSTEIPDLVVDQCPLGCINCSRVYINTLTGHRIVCECKLCGHNKEKEELARVVGPEASTFLITQSPKEVIHDDR